MNRRKFGIVGGVSLAAMASGLGSVRPARAAANASLLTTTLTPFGAERAGNADGSIPAWTGGLTEIPAGWTQSKGLMPDFFADDKKIVSIDASNMEQYKDRLSEGVMKMMTKWGFRIDVYPTHRTFSAPQYVYDNAVKNVSSAVAAPQGAKYGVTGAYGAIPWPILDPDPAVAGAQAMVNHGLLYQGEGWSRFYGDYLVDENGTRTFIDTTYEETWYPYYQAGERPENYSGFYQKAYLKNTAPASLVGQETVYQYPVNTYNNPERIWEYLPGQGRVREAPNLAYDTPAPSMEEYMNMDEYAVFTGALDRYDWKLIGKKEMYVPYNNNKLILSTPQEGLQSHFLNPDLVRWELHRVWIVEGTLSPGKRNVLAKRRYYLDEDSWLACLGDTYDAQGNYWRHGQLMIENRPDIPAGVMPAQVMQYDFQANRYIALNGIWNQAPFNHGVVVGTPPQELFNPQAMAAQAQF